MGRTPPAPQPPSKETLKFKSKDATPPLSVPGSKPQRNASPKRRSTAAPVALKVDTQRVIDATGSESGGDSPRTRVADRLKDLDLHRVAVNGSRRSQTPEYTRGTHEGPRKRRRMSSPPPPVAVIKTNSSSERQTNSGERDSIRAANPIEAKVIEHPETPVNEKGVSQSKVPTREAEDQKTPHANYARNGNHISHIDRELDAAEIGETPDCRTSKLPSSPPPPADRRPTSKRKQDEMSTDLPLADEIPLPKSPHSTNSTVDPSISPTQLPTSEDPEDSSSPSFLTWHDDEITGHNIDSAADDDGEGINGIGFRPTPAIAYARSQRRKQQVNEWRAREAREARQRRFEKRRGGSDEGGLMARKTRTVRFMTDD